MQSIELDPFGVAERETPVERGTSHPRLVPKRYASEYRPGAIIRGKYRLERVLGEGGVGTVWLARNLVLDSAVALKLMRSDLDGPDVALRLLDEARAEAKLEHRAVVRVFDFGETERGTPFIVMELLEGANLATWLEHSGKLEPIWAVQMLLPIVDALACAHELGIVHRDLKPENLFLARSGRSLQPKVVDFGIAKLCHNPADLRRTLAGCVLGTPAYMAPEQARGLEDVDHRADIWAVCVVLYEALSGEVPFGGASYNAILRSVIEDEIIPLKSWGIAEPELSRIIARGLAKDRGARHSSMRELGNELASWLHQRGIREDITGETLNKTWKLAKQEPRVSRRFVVLSTCGATVASLVALFVSLASPAAAEAESLLRVGPAVAARFPDQSARVSVAPVSVEEESAARTAADTAPAQTVSAAAPSQTSAVHVRRALAPRGSFLAASGDVKRRAALAELKDPYR